MSGHGFGAIDDAQHSLPGPPLRGRGLGTVVAAYALHAVGASLPGVFVAAQARSNKKDDPSVEQAATGSVGARFVGAESTRLWVGGSHDYDFTDGWASELPDVAECAGADL